ncbi:MFS transporter, partial [Klebsiella pneumoniae]
GFFHQMYQPFKWNMMANAADYGEWKFGRRITGLSYSGNLFALKMGMAVAGAAVGFSLGLFGYQAGVTAQTPLATMGIVGLLTLGPSLSYLLLWWLARFYKLDDKMMQTIQRELSMRQQQGHSETHLPLNAVPEKA